MPEGRGGSKGEHLLECLAGMVAAEAARVLGVGEELAKLLGDEVATKFSADFGGDMTYIPEGRVFKKSRLHRKIYDAFTGDNHAELAKAFRVSVIHVYRVIAREAERERRRRQGTLPGFPA